MSDPANKAIFKPQLVQLDGANERAEIELRWNRRVSKKLGSSTSFPAKDRAT